MLECDEQLDFSQTALLSVRPGENAPPARATEILEGLMKEAREGLDAEGIPPSSQSFAPFADIRYLGQSFEIAIPFGHGFVEAFEKAHETLYGFSLDDTPIELVTLRVRAVGSTPSPALTASSITSAEAVPHRMTPMLFEEGPVEGAIFHREQLTPGMYFKGPALIVEYSSTTTVAPGWRGEVDAWGSLILRKGEER